MKRITIIIFTISLLSSGCMSLEKLNAKKERLETAIDTKEQATRDEIAGIEAEIDKLIAIIDSSNSLSDDAGNNARIAELQEKVNAVAVKGRDKVDKLALRLRNLEHKITTRMNTENIDSY